MPAAAVLAELDSDGAERGSFLAVAVGRGGTGLATATRSWAIDGDHTAAVVTHIDTALRPRWVMWDQDTARRLVSHGAAVSTSWDVAAVHRLLFGGWQATPQRTWATLYGIDHRRAPTLGQLDLLAATGDAGAAGADDPVQPDGYLRPEWVHGAWERDAGSAARWAHTALVAAERQRERIAALHVAGSAAATAHAESTAELLCAELAAEGLPVSRTDAESLLGTLVGPRPTDAADDELQRARRDAPVLAHLPPGSGVDLRSPASVKVLLHRLGIDVSDTRAWRLRELRGTHPVIDDLLHWRSTERFATTYGYRWLDSHLGADGRLRGEWSASDGGAGRMTAQAGLHSIPTELRPIVVAEPGHLFVRADLGQIEPRVLAAISGDPALVRATFDDDLYAPVARRLGVERPVAKVAVLAAMYGQTSGTAGQALRGMESAYPTAIDYLNAAAAAGVAGRELRTYGGRLLRMYDIGGAANYGAAAAGRGRFARNAVVQGAAAELFKVWAVTFRSRSAALDARIVLCLHDELLIHVPEPRAEGAAALLVDCLDEAAHRWQRGAGVRFVANVSIARSWADAKG